MFEHETAGGGQLEAATVGENAAEHNLAVQAFAEALVTEFGRDTEIRGQLIQCGSRGARRVMSVDRA